MTDPNETVETITLAFANACPRPTMADVRSWSTRYPEFTREILEEAELLILSEAMPSDPVVSLSREDEEAAEALSEAIATDNQRRRSALVKKARSKASAPRDRSPPEASR